MIVVEWALAVPDNPGFVTFVLGAFVCMELAVHVRHLGNLHLFGSASRRNQLPADSNMPGL